MNEHQASATDRLRQVLCPSNRIGRIERSGRIHELKAKGTIVAAEREDEVVVVVPSPTMFDDVVDELGYTKTGAEYGPRAHLPLMTDVLYPLVDGGSIGLAYAKSPRLGLYRCLASE